MQVLDLMVQRGKMEIAENRVHQHLEVLLPTMIRHSQGDQLVQMALMGKMGLMVFLEKI